MSEAIIATLLRHDIGFTTRETNKEQGILIVSLGHVSLDEIVKPLKEQVVVAGQMILIQRKQLLEHTFRATSQPNLSYKRKLQFKLQAKGQTTGVGLAANSLRKLTVYCNACYDHNLQY